MLFTCNGEKRGSYLRQDSDYTDILCGFKFDVFDHASLLI